MSVQQLTDSVHVDTRRRGSNHGFVRTSDGIVLVDTPFKPTDALRLREELRSRGPVRYTLNTEPHVDHWTGNTFFDAPVVAHEGVRRRILETPVAEHRERIASLGPDEPAHAESYAARAPEITFATGMTLHIGDHAVELIHMPGHTRYQAAVVIAQEGVVFTSDNLFNGVHTWLQEADPDAWLESLDALRGLDVDTFVPGHGDVCGRDALDRQEETIHDWVRYVRGGVEAGLTRDEAMDGLTAFTDRFPMDVEQDGLAPKVMRMNVANLYDFITRRGIHAPA